MMDTKRKTLKIRQKDEGSELTLDKKSVAPRAPDIGEGLDHHNGGMVGEQRLRVNHPHDQGS